MRAFKIFIYLGIFLFGIYSLSMFLVDESKSFIIEKEIKYHEKNILDIENTTMLKGKTTKEEAEIEFKKV